MGWSIGVGKDGRDIGYGVPALCDHPDCAKNIDRGLSYVCGMINTDGEDRGCGLHFCTDHLRHSEKFGQLCFRCWPRSKAPFERKPDVREWVEHKLSDESWAAWRSENAAQVASLSAQPLYSHEDVLALKKALQLAANMIMANEPGDSRAVSNEAVAICAVSCGDVSPEVMRVVDDALRQFEKLESQHEQA